MIASLKPVRILALAGALPYLEFNAAALELPMLKALSMIETSNDDWAVGKQGERGRYQISEAVWTHYCNLSFRKYVVKKDYSDTVATIHINKLGEKFRSVTHRNITAEDIYVMWNAGYTYYKKHDFDFAKIHKSIRERAIRYSNLVYYYQNLN